MHKYVSSSLEITKKRNNDTFNYDEDSELDMEGDDFFFPKQESPQKKKHLKKKTEGSPKDIAVDRMCKSLQTQRMYGSSVDSFASSVSSTVTDTSGVDSNDEDMAGDIIGNLLSTSTMYASSSWKRESYVDSFHHETKHEHLQSASVPANGFAKTKKLKKKKDLSIIAGQEKRSTSKWFRKSQTDSDDESDATTDSGSDASALDVSPLPQPKNEIFSIEIPIPPRPMVPTNTEAPPETPATAPKSTIDEMFDQTPPDSISRPIQAKDYKQSALTIFLLQHVCRQYNPDPAFFEKMCNQLHDSGYLNDDRSLTLEQLKQACKSIMVDVIKNVSEIILNVYNFGSGQSN
jgi:hypothetical protein